MSTVSRLSVTRKFGRRFSMTVHKDFLVFLIITDKSFYDVTLSEKH